jgi:hypothetical protein
MTSWGNRVAILFLAEPEGRLLSRRSAGKRDRIFRPNRTLDCIDPVEMEVYVGGG